MTRKSDVWEHCHRQLRLQLSEQEFDRWIEPLRADHLGGALKLSSTNRWEGRKVEEQFGDLIERIARDVSGDDSLKILYDTRRSGATAIPLRTNKERPISNRASSSDLEGAYTFDRFVTGNTKHIEKAVAMDVANSFSEESMSVVIFGNSGLGKSHLLHAIGHHINETNPEKAIKVAHSTTFASEVSTILSPQGKRNASTNQLMQNLQNQYAAHDVILFEDLHRLVRMPKIQEEFLQLLNMWQERRTKLAFTSLGPMNGLEELEPALRSRLLGGVSIRAVEPDEKTKVEILLHQADEEQIDLPQDVAEYLASQTTGDIRILKGTLISIVKVHRFSRPNQGRLTREIIDDALRNQNIDRKPVTADRILRLVSERFEVSVMDIKSGARVHSKLIPRQMGMLLTHELTSLPLTEIATVFGRKDHSTVKNALASMSRKLKIDRNLRLDYDWLKAELRK